MAATSLAKQAGNVAGVAAISVLRGLGNAAAGFLDGLKIGVGKESVGKSQITPDPGPVAGSDTKAQEGEDTSKPKVSGGERPRPKPKSKPKAKPKASAKGKAKPKASPKEKAKAKSSPKRKPKAKPKASKDLSKVTQKEAKLAASPEGQVTDKQAILPKAKAKGKSKGAGEGHGIQTIEKSRHRLHRPKKPKAGKEPTASTSFQDGEAVMCRQADGWYPTAVKRKRDDGTFDIEGEESVNPSRLRLTRLEAPEQSPLVNVMNEEYGKMTLLKVLQKTLLDKDLCQWLAKSGNQVGAKMINDSAYKGKGLTKEELGALHVYTKDAMVTGGPKLYAELNRALDEWDSSPVVLRRYLPLLQLLIKAYEKIGGEPWGKLYRSEPWDYSRSYKPGQEITWWSFKSTSNKDITVEQFMGEKGPNTIFRIAAKRGLGILQLSAHKEEHEVLLFPGTRMRVTQIITSQENQVMLKAAVCQVMMEEIDPFPNRWSNAR